MENPNTYLQHLLTTSGKYEVTNSDKHWISKDLEGFIFAKLTSKKFRKTKLHPDCAARTKHAIQTRIEADQPLRIVFPQGGYKLWRFPTSPNADWAEFFNISYLLQYIAPIAAAYKPSVNLVYYMHTLLMELHDNLTTEEVDAYVDSFQNLIDEFSKYLPNNISISILKDADIYPRKEYFKILETASIQVAKDFDALPKEKQDALKRMAELNIKWDGKEDWTNFSNKEKAEKIRLAGIYEMAASSHLPKVMANVKADDTILAFTIGTPQFIGIGSTKASVAKYWVGFGVLEEKEDSYLPLILSPSQYQAMLKRAPATADVTLFDSPNFERIFVLS